MTGTAAADGRPSGMFVAHAATITEAWLALTEHGHLEEIEVAGWLTDRAGWQEWHRADGWSAHPHRLTPDAVATLRIDGAETVAFIEVDLATMTQTLLKQKVARYLAYAHDRAWEGRHPHCPPMLLLTTTQTRAATFARAAGQVLAQSRRVFDRNDPAASLVIAACGLVRGPARAVAEPCWVVPDSSAADLTLAELLVERVGAQAASEAWQIEQDTVVRRRAAIEALSDVRSLQNLADWLGSKKAAEALRVICVEPIAFLDNEPNLATEVVEWFTQRRRINRFDARRRARPFVSLLEDRHEALWAEQAGRLLAARAHVASAHPRVCRLATILASGNLVDPPELSMLDVPPSETRDQIQCSLLRHYTAHRVDAVERGWSALGRWGRRHVSREQLATAFDAEQLSVCDTCGLSYPPQELGGVDTYRCLHCGGQISDQAVTPQDAPPDDLFAKIKRVDRAISQPTPP